MLERIFERPLRFNESDLARSVSHAGDDSRLRLALGKLLRGALQSIAGAPCSLQLTVHVCGYSSASSTSQHPIHVGWLNRGTYTLPATTAACGLRSASSPRCAMNI